MFILQLTLQIFQKSSLVWQGFMYILHMLHKILKNSLYFSKLHVYFTYSLSKIFFFYHGPTKIYFLSPPWITCNSKFAQNPFITFTDWTLTEQVVHWTRKQDPVLSKKVKLMAFPSFLQRLLWSTQYKGLKVGHVSSEASLMLKVTFSQLKKEKTFKITFSHFKLKISIVPSSGFWKSKTTWENHGV